jgi:hypothetical protein
LPTELRMLPGLLLPTELRMLPGLLLPTELRMPIGLLLPAGLLLPTGLRMLPGLLLVRGAGSGRFLTPSAAGLAQVPQLVLVHPRGGFTETGSAVLGMDGRAVRGVAREGCLIIRGHGGAEQGARRVRVYGGQGDTGDQKSRQGKGQTKYRHTHDLSSPDNDLPAKWEGMVGDINAHDYPDRSPACEGGHGTFSRKLMNVLLAVPEFRCHDLGMSAVI